MTNSTAFIRWFGNSQVTGPRGPLVVYHGTDADFEAFEFSEDIGFHFGSALTAETRVLHAGMQEPRIIPVYLSIANPLRLPDLYTWDPNRVLDALIDAEIIDCDQADNICIVDRETVATLLAKKGYDGIVYGNETEGGGDSYIAFDPSQIKSIFNSGAFNKNSPKILE